MLALVYLPAFKGPLKQTQAQGHVPNASVGLLADSYAQLSAAMNWITSTLKSHLSYRDTSSYYIINETANV